MPTLPLPRTSLASLLCPSAPFLAPRLLRTPACAALLPTRCTTPLAGLQRAYYAQEARTRPQWSIKRRPVDERPRRQRQRQTEATDEAAPVLKLLLAACDTMSVRTLLELYPGLVAANALHRNHTRRIAQTLNARVRNMRNTDVSLDDIFVFAQRMVSDIQTGALPPHPYAHVHLLGVYKQCERYQEGYDFWQWLVDRDSMHVTQAVYGAALDLMAYRNIHPLSDLEDLYAEGLKRFPGVFAEYHLSPEAIVPDRSQPVAISNVPVLLLQGILTARLLAGDWHNAYLALDTALRLFPTQVPARFFDLFMVQRPLPEAYTAFLVACRAGVPLKPNRLTGLITKVRKEPNNASLRERVTSLRAVANAMYAYLEAGGSLEPLHLRAFIRTFESVIPAAEDGRTPFDGEVQMRNAIATAVHEFASTLLQAGFPPHAHIFTAIIHLAGKYKVPGLFQTCLEDIQAAQLKLEATDLRTILDAAGYLGEKDVIQTCWSRIASESQAKGEQLDYSDWVTLAEACSFSGHLDYFHEQLWKYEHTLSAGFKQGLADKAKTKPHKTRSLKPNMDFAAFTTEFDALQSQMKNIAAVVMSRQPLDLRTTPFYMTLDPTRPPLGQPEDLRTVYDEMTTDPHQPAPPSGTIPPALSPTGIPLDELRFQNWVSVLGMMNHARLHAPGNKSQPFGGVVQDGLPLPLDTLRETIQYLRSRVPIQRVAHVFAKDAVREQMHNRLIAKGKLSLPSDGAVENTEPDAGLGQQGESLATSSDPVAPERKPYKPKPRRDHTSNPLGILRGDAVRQAGAGPSRAEDVGQVESSQEPNSSTS